MKHVVTRPFTLPCPSRLRETYRRQPLLKPLLLPAICTLGFALMILLFVDGGGPLFPISAVGLLGSIVWLTTRCTKRFIAFGYAYFKCSERKSAV